MTISFELVELSKTSTNARPPFIEPVLVRETLEDNTLWEGVVHLFKIWGRPKAEKAYAWSSLVEGSEELQYFAVLHEGRITSPQDAVRAVIWEDWGRR